RRVFWLPGACSTERLMRARCHLQVRRRAYRDLEEFSVMKTRVVLIGLFLALSAGYARAQGLPCNCPGDVNRDCHVDIDDLGLLLAGFGANPFKDDSFYLPEADLHFDGFIDINDLAIVLSNFGRTCTTPEPVYFEPGPTTPPRSQPVGCDPQGGKCACEQ